MKNYPDHFDYVDLEAIVERARVERSIALGNGIASLFAAATSRLSRLADAVKSAVRGSKSATIADSGPIPDASGHR